MTKEDLNCYVDYRGLYSEIKESHLKMFPAPEDYYKDYLRLTLSELSDDGFADIKDMYSFMLTDLKFFDCLEIDNENSTINLDSNELTITFVDDCSTNTESGYSSDYSLWAFEVDVEIGCFKKYYYEH